VDEDTPYGPGAIVVNPGPKGCIWWVTGSQVGPSGHCGVYVDLRDENSLEALLELSEYCKSMPQDCYDSGRCQILKIFDYMGEVPGKVHFTGMKGHPHGPDTD